MQSGSPSILRPDMSRQAGAPLPESVLLEIVAKLSPLLPYRQAARPET